MILNKKAMLVTVLCTGMVLMQSFVQKRDDDKAENLKVLPKDISGKELHQIMKNYSIALGVRCNFCHVSEQVEGQEHPKFDFASDGKPEKKITRDMMLMVNAINNNYLGKMIGGDHPLEQITCVTCHNGKKTPVISIDSLVKK